MDVRIAFVGQPTDETSYAFDELAAVLSDEGLSNRKEQSIPQAGRKDGGLTLVIALAGLGVSAIGTLITVLSYWKSTRPKYRISVSRGAVTIEVENLDAAQISEATTRLTAVGQHDGALVEITTDEL